jgi:hypothetical protein
VADLNELGIRYLGRCDLHAQRPALFVDQQVDGDAFAFIKTILEPQWLGQSDVEGVQTRILPWMLSTVECGPAERF